MSPGAPQGGVLAGGSASFGPGSGGYVTPRLGGGSLEGDFFTVDEEYDEVRERRPGVAGGGADEALVLAALSSLPAEDRGSAGLELVWGFVGNQGTDHAAALARLGPDRFGALVESARAGAAADPPKDDEDEEVSNYSDRE